MEGWTLNGEIFLETDGNTNSMMFDIATDEGSGYEVRTSPLSFSTWYHMAATYDGHEQRIYLNGILEDSETWSSTFTITTGITIGRDYEAEIQYLDGIVDEVRIWNRALTLEEIQINMYSHLTGFEEGLVGYWPFNEGSGSTVNDFSGNNNQGTVYGATWIGSGAPVGTVIIYCNPNYGYQNHNLFTSVQGANTNFSNGANNVWLSKEENTITADRYTVKSNTLLDVKFYIPPKASLGQWNINVETIQDSIITMPVGIEILPPPSVIFQNSATSSWLRSLYALNNQTCWSVGNEGSIQKTIDGGITWELQNSGTSDVLNSVYFKNEQNGWAVGQYGTILSTTNGGEEWNAQNSSTSNNLQSIYFVDTLTGWIVGRSGTILKTLNGGSDWEPQTSGTTSWLYSVYFTDGNNGWAVGSNGTILNSTNGGETWESQISGTTNYLLSVHFYDSNTGWAVGSKGTILKTTDGGKNWKIINGGTMEWLRSAYFRDSLTGWAVGTNGVLIVTVDGGTTWSKGRSFTTKTLSSIYFADDITGWAVGESGTILSLTMSNLATAIDNDFVKSSLPRKLVLYQNYPNPFNPRTIINYELPKTNDVILSIYNLLGQNVAILVNEQQIAGHHQIEWDASGYASGVYYYRIEAGEFQDVKKMILFR
jgi:photosystem II stability/assembly factor-like uncharacterized protein